jgi:hypothetical protein
MIVLDQVNYRTAYFKHAHFEHHKTVLSTSVTVHTVCLEKRGRCMMDSVAN